MQARLTLVCSGLAAAARRGAFPAAGDALDDRALAQAAAARPLLAPAVRALSAPDLRARQTALAFGLAATEEDALRDQDFGRWAGRELDEVGGAEPQALAAWLSGPDAAPGGGEPFSAVAARAAAWLDSLRGVPGHTVAITHAAFVRAALLAVLGAPASCFARIDVAPLSLTDLRGDGRRWQLRATGVLGGCDPSRRS